MCNATFKNFFQSCHLDSNHPNCGFVILQQLDVRFVGNSATVEGFWVHSDPRRVWKQTQSDSESLGWCSPEVHCAGPLRPWHCAYCVPPPSTTEHCLNQLGSDSRPLHDVNCSVGLCTQALLSQEHSGLIMKNKLFFSTYQISISLCEPLQGCLVKNELVANLSFI